jgi:hypothetical protein
MVTLAAPTPIKIRWPLQRNCSSFYGDPSDPADPDKPSERWEKAQLVHAIPPWKMVETDTRDPVPYFQVHRKVLPSLNRVLLTIWMGYGQDQAAIEKEHLHCFSGSFVYRSIRHGHGLSMHSYGVAIDLADNVNQQGSHAYLMPAQAVAAFEAEGWVWGGRWAGSTIDPMHFQAARVA